MEVLTARPLPIAAAELRQWLMPSMRPLSAGYRGWRQPPLGLCPYPLWLLLPAWAKAAAKRSQCVRSLLLIRDGGTQLLGSAHTLCASSCCPAWAKAAANSINASAFSHSSGIEPLPAWPLSTGCRLSQWLMLSMIRFVSLMRREVPRLGLCPLLLPG